MDAIYEGYRLCRSSLAEPSRGFGSDDAGPGRQSVRNPVQNGGNTAWDSQTGHPRAVDYRLLAKWVEHLLPFAGLLAVIFMYHFFTGIFLCVWLGCSVHKANDVLRKIVARTACEQYEIAAAVIFVGTNVALTLWLTGAQQVRALVLLPPPAPLTVWQVAFSVAVTDSLVRCCGIIPKLLIAAATMLPGRNGGVAKRASLDAAAVAAAAAAAGGSSSPGVARRPSSCGSVERASLDATAAGGGGCSTSRSSSLASASSLGGCCSSSSCSSSSGPRRSAEFAGTGGDGGCRVPRSSTSSSSSLGVAPCELAPVAPPSPCSPRPSNVPSTPLQPAGPSGRLTLTAGYNHGACAAQVAARRRARMLALYDNVQASYRVLLPVPVWYCFLLRSTPNGLLNSLLAAAYLMVKAHGVFQRGQFLLLATRLVLRTGALYGRYLTKGEVSACGEPPACPICCEVCAAPIRLDCSHIFCEACLAEWLEREPTCPMCRSTVKPPGLTFGDGSTTLLPQIF